jgi:hypothetical protein
VRLSTDSAFTATLVSDSTLTDTSRTVISLSAGARYYWQVRGRNAGGPGSWSPRWQFSIDPSTARAYGILQGWNLLSLPLAVQDGRPSVIFPGATSLSYGFEPASGYGAVDTLRTGRGYWVKFDVPETVTVSGNVILSDSIPVTAGWNMIGAISSTLDTAQVQSVPPGIRESALYRYNDGYTIVSALEPSHGYWVKVSQNGFLLLVSATQDRHSAIVRRTARR